MHKFYFNECVPTQFNEVIFISSLANSIKEFNTLILKNIQIEHSIITEKLPSAIKLNNEFTLLTSIEKISELNIRRLAYSYFNKYPIHDYYVISEDLEIQLLENEYSINIDQEKINALNIAIVSKNKGIALSSAIHDDYKKNHLQINSKNNIDNLVISNLYGFKDNTDFIIAELEKVNAETLDNIGKLKQILGNSIFSNQFEKDFNRLAIGEQESIITYFEKAKARKLVTNFCSDTKIISDVTPIKYNCSVLELRVYAPTALRVYFNESNDIVYLGCIGFKNENTQNEDIKKAHNIIYKLHLTI